MNLYCKGKSEAIQRAYQTLNNMHNGGDIYLRFPTLEEVNPEYNGKVPICF